MQWRIVQPDDLFVPKTLWLGLLLGLLSLDLFDGANPCNSVNNGKEHFIVTLRFVYSFKKGMKQHVFLLMAVANDLWISDHERFGPTKVH